MDQNRHDIDENLLLQYLQGNADETLKVSVEAWLNADRGNRKILDQMESLWLETGRISPAPVVVDVEAAWINMEYRLIMTDQVSLADRNPASGELPALQQMQSSDLLTRSGTRKLHEKTATISSGEPGLHRKEKTIRMLYARYIFRAAAMIVLLIGLYSLYWQFLKPVNEIVLSGETRVLHDTLPDGSKITLNRESKLVYPDKFSKYQRTVKLTGEAFFEVKHDAAHPFVVDAGLARIRVLGTSFSVKTQTQPTRMGNPVRVVEVTVIEGSVMLFTVDVKSGDTASVILASGETGVLESGSSRPVLSGLAAPDNTFWANRSLDFRGTALRDVLTLLKKYYPVSITVSNPEILECRLTASFVNEPVSRILLVISESFGLRLEGRGENYLLTGNGCGGVQN